MLWGGILLDQVEVQGYPVNVHLRGSGEKTLVLIHGAGGSGLHWMENEPPPGWRFAAVDLPGHGASGGLPMNDVFEYASWAAEFVTAYGGCDLVAGHSMGGAITMALALTKPELIRGIILVGTGAKLGVSQVILDACQHGITATVEELLAKLAYGPKPTIEQIKDWYESFGEASCQAYLGGFTACNRFDIRSRLSSIALPALLVCGVEDRLTPLKYTQFLLHNLPNARLEAIEDAGHMVMLEQSQAFNRVLAGFLSEF